MEKFTFGRKEAAEAVGVSLPTLDAMLNREANPVPHFRIGKKVLIPVESFRQWLIDEAGRRVDSGRAV